MLSKNPNKAPEAAASPLRRIHRGSPLLPCLVLLLAVAPRPSSANFLTKMNLRKTDGGVASAAGGGGQPFELNQVDVHADVNLNRDATRGNAYKFDIDGSIDDKEGNSEPSLAVAKPIESFTAVMDVIKDAKLFDDEDAFLLVATGTARRRSRSSRRRRRRRSLSHRNMRRRRLSVGAEDKSYVGEVYLTFDDGPQKYTPGILDVLSEMNVKATFLLCGFLLEWDQPAREAFKRLVDDGHIIANHSYDHMAHNAPVIGYVDVQTDADFFHSNTKFFRDMIEEHTGQSNVLQNDKLDSIARLPYTNAFRVDHLITDCRCCTLDGEGSECPSESGKQSVLVADRLLSDGMKVYGWDLIWEEANSGEELAELAEERSKVDPCLRHSPTINGVETSFCDSTGHYGKVIVISHDQYYADGEELNKLRNFIMSVKDRGFVFKTLDQYEIVASVLSDEEEGENVDSDSRDKKSSASADNNANGESGDYVATEGTKGGGGDKALDEDIVEELSSVAGVLNDKEEGENVDSGDKKNSVSSKPKDVPVEVQEDEEEEEPTEKLLDSAADDDEDSKDEVGEVMATNEDEEAVVLDDTAAKKSATIDGDDDEVAEEEADEKANNLGGDSSYPLESVTISNLKDSVSDNEDAVAESIEKDWETKVEIPLDKELAAVDNTAAQQQSKSDFVDNNEKSSDGHEYLPDDGSGDDYAGEGRGKVMKTGEWDEDDDDDKVDVSASEMKSSVGGGVDTNQKTEQEFKTEIENKLEMALEEVDLEEEQVEELDEEMEEAIDEGAGAVSELNLREADKEIVTGGTTEEGNGVTKTAGMAIIGLSRDDNASTVVLVDDPPVIGEVSGVAASSSSVSEEGTNPSNNIQGHTFDNLLCKDDPESYLAAENICESIKRRIDEGVCDKELFTVDLDVQGDSSVNIDGDASVNASEVLRLEEAVHSTNDDDVNNGQRHLTFKAGYYDKNGEVAGLLQGDTQSSGTITATSNKLIVTVGSRHCPETCNVVSECERAREYFNPENKSNSTMGIVQLSEAEFDTNAETDDNVSLLGSDYPDDGNAASNDYVPSGQEVEHEGQEYVSEGKLANTSCQDDSNFLYKDKPGFTCEYIAANKPDKCVKPLIVTSCPVSCNMVEECEQLMKGVSAASIDDKEGNLEVSDLKNAMSTGLNTGPIEEEESIIFEDETPAELLGNTTAMHEVSCKDDKQFLYKDKPGFTCEYIALNKPDKCFKLHNGDKVGAISCPESCNMIQECEDMYDATGVVMGTNNSGNSLDTKTIAEEEQSLLVEGESGGFDDKGFELTGEDMEEMSAVDSVNTTEVPGVEQEDITDPKLANDRSDGYESGVNWSADSEDEPLVPTATEPSTLCKDSESFLYKDKPGYTCAVLGEMKPDKCLKLHNGVAIGLTSCPQSCDMVGQCLDAVQEGVVPKSTAVVSNEYNKETSYTAAVQDGDEGEVSFAKGRGSIMQGVEDVATVDQNKGDNGADEELKYMHDEEETMRKGDVMASMGTKSMADEIFDESSNSFGGSAFKSSVDNDDYKESTDDDMEGGYNNNPYQVTESFEQNIDGKRDETEDEMSRNNGWDNNQVDEDYNEGFPNSNNWDDNNDAEWGDESNSWNDKSLGEKELPWDTPTNNLDNSFGDALPTNNVVPSGQETVPSLNTDTDGYAWELDDDEGGFPAGLFIALLAVFIFFVYRNRQNRNEASRDCTSRGGYQRVHPLEGHSKKW